MSFRIVIGLAVALVLWQTATAQTYPERPIRWIMPYSVGGASDGVARMMAPEMGKLLNGQVIVENRVGAGGTIGTDAAAKAAPDGHTWVWGGSAALAVNVTLQKNLPYDPLSDFAPVCRIGVAPYVLVVHPALGVTSLKDLVGLAKARGSDMTYASPGNGTGSHLAMELLKSRAGISLRHVLYKGTAPAVTDVLANHVPLLFEAVGPLAPHVRSGKLIALATTAGKRLPALPDVPTMKELGFDDFQIEAWTGLLVPAKTPPAIVARLDDACRQVLSPRDFQEAVSRQHGLEPDYAGREEFRDFMRSEISKWAKLLALSNAKLD